MLKMASSSGCGWWLEEHTVFVDILIKKSLIVKTFSDLKIEQIFYNNIYISYRILVMCIERIKN